MDSSSIFDTDVEILENMSTTDQISCLGNELPNISSNCERSIEELVTQMKTNEDIIKKKVALESCRIELQKLESLTEVANSLLDELEPDVTTSVSEEEMTDEEALINNLTENVEFDLSEGDIDDIDNIEF